MRDIQSPRNFALDEKLTTSHADPKLHDVVRDEKVGVNDFFWRRQRSIVETGEVEPHK